MPIEKNQVQHYSQVVKFLIMCGAIGPTLFIIVFLIEGAIRPGYSAWRDFVSDLSLGYSGWIQIINFLVCGLLTLGFAIGLWLVLRKGSIGVPILLGIFSLGLIAAGLFSTDPNLGYPPGSPPHAPQTFHGAVHGVAGNAVFLSVALASMIMARRFVKNPHWKGWTIYSILTGVAVILLFIASNVTSVLDMIDVLPNAPTGLIQRVAIILGWGWIALLALQILLKMRLGKQQALF